MDARRPPRLKPGDLSTDLEIALHRILSRQAFSGRPEIYVSEGDDGGGPYYVVLIDIRAARIVSQFLGNPPHLPINSDPAIWTLDLDLAQAIVATSK